MKFMPVPPNTSLAMITPKAMATAACQSGVVAGRMRGNSRPVTKKPSLTSTRRITEKVTSIPSPTSIVTIYRGKKYTAPCAKLSSMLAGL